MIRPATPLDAPAIARVHVDSWRETYKGLVPDEYLASLSYQQREQMWRRGLENPGWKGRLFVAADTQDGVVGFVAGGPSQAPDSGFDAGLWAIYLLKRHQKKGLGERLFKTFVSIIQAEGFRSMMLWVLAENPTVGFYKRMGGVKVGEKEEEIAGKKLVEYAFGWRDLGSLK